MRGVLDTKQPLEEEKSSKTDILPILTTDCHLKSLDDICGIEDANSTDRLPLVGNGSK